MYHRPPVFIFRLFVKGLRIFEVVQIAVGIISHGFSVLFALIVILVSSLQREKLFPKTRPRFAFWHAAIAADMPHVCLWFE